MIIQWRQRKEKVEQAADSSSSSATVVEGLKEGETDGGGESVGVLEGEGEGGEEGLALGEGEYDATSHKGTRHFKLSIVDRAPIKAQKSDFRSSSLPRKPVSMDMTISVDCDSGSELVEELIEEQRE